MSNTITFLKKAQVSEMTCVGESTILTKVRMGTFPKPIKLGERAVAWNLVDVQKWMQDRIDASKGEEL